MWCLWRQVKRPSSSIAFATLKFPIVPILAFIIPVPLTFLLNHLNLYSRTMFASFREQMVERLGLISTSLKSNSVCESICIYTKIIYRVERVPHPAIKHHLHNWVTITSCNNTVVSIGFCITDVIEVFCRVAEQCGCCIEHTSKFFHNASCNTL